MGDFNDNAFVSKVTENFMQKPAENGTLIDHIYIKDIYPKIYYTTATMNIFLLISYLGPVVSL